MNELIQFTDFDEASSDPGFSISQGLNTFCLVTNASKYDATLQSVRQKAKSDSTLEPKVIRPIQYLGSKLRAIDTISKKVEQISSSGATVLDLFSGSTVVSQSLADKGFRLIASDAMQYSHFFASALLGIGRDTDNIDSDSLSDLILSGVDSSSLSSLFDKWLKEEKSALSSSDGSRLIELSKVFPQIWRNDNATKKVSCFFNQLREGEGRLGFNTPGLVTAYYASTYFGIEQSIAIDSIRCSIEAAKNSNTIDSWSYNACVVALLSSASKAVFTPGKHFAQYHKVSGSKNLSFHRKRIISDRSVVIEEEFKNSLREIFARPICEKDTHRALHKSMEELVANPDGLGNIDLIYADPPYTAQQYSRFYHIPEIIGSYYIPELQLISGEPTIGIYNNNRFKSRFSSKTFAPEAFRDLAALARAKKCDLLVSYSESKSGITGNSRMIGLDDLKKIFMESFDSVEVIPLDLQYRQFNSADSLIIDKDDRELMIYCRNVT